MQSQHRPRAGLLEKTHQRLSLNGTSSMMLKHLVPSPRPLFRGTSTRSINPLTAHEQQMAELDGSTFSTHVNGSIASSGGGIGVANSERVGNSLGGGSGMLALGLHTTDLSITPAIPNHQQIFDLDSLGRYTTQQSFLDLGSKIAVSHEKFGQSVSQQGLFASHDSINTPCASHPSIVDGTNVKTVSELDFLHNSKTQLKSTGAVDDNYSFLGSWSRTIGEIKQDTFLPSNINGGLNKKFYCNGTERSSPSRRVKSIGKMEQKYSQQNRNNLRYSASFKHKCQPKYNTSNISSQQSKQELHWPYQLQTKQQHQLQEHSQSALPTGLRNTAPTRKLHFVFDPAGRFCYYWSMVVSLAFIYNFWVIIYRFAFQEINENTIAVWFCLDYFSDFLYLVDIFFHFRTGYLEDGVLQTDAAKLRTHYMNSTTFYVDCLCLLPLDFLYLSLGFNSILRSFRLVKIYRFWAFMDRTERHTNYPNLLRSTALIHYLLVIFHWNGCLYHLIHKNNGFGSRNWVYHDSESADVVKQYLQSFYWCTLALTTIGDLPKPRSKGEYVFVIIQMLFGLMLFATVLGHVANIVTSVSASRKEFQAKLDGVKTYMRMRRVPNQLQIKVIKWFDYLWLTQKCSDEERAVSCLPDKLKAEIAINVHLDTLKRVEIFQNTEAGFLCELVLRLRPVLFSPGDFICRKGEVGKEMYIVNRGRLQVVADNGKTVMASLKAGSYFGEISILNMGTAGKQLGNRRTASVRSVGYSDLFVLSKKDMWDVLKEYPAARVRLESIAVKRLEKYKKAPLEKIAMGRCQSTPGLVESCGRTTCEDMWLPSFPHQPKENIQHMTLSPNSTRTDGERTMNSIVELAGSISPSGSDDRHRSYAGLNITARPLSQPNRSDYINDSNIHLEHFCVESSRVGEGTTPLLGSHEALEDEIKRLRERLHTVESENQALNKKLSQQQWDVENRLAEIEMQICGVSSTSSLDPEVDTEEMERNRESII